MSHTVSLSKYMYDRVIAPRSVPYSRFVAILRLCAYMATLIIACMNQYRTIVI